MQSLLRHPHIVPAEEIAARLRAVRAQNPRLRLVFTNGCYDLLHPGHVDLLARARMLGDLLVLGLNSDASVRLLGKPPLPPRPVQPLAVRAYLAAHLASVDLVTAFDEATPWALIRELQPDVLVKGGDWPLEQIVGRDIVEARGGLVISLPLLPGFSTTGLIAQIVQGAAGLPGHTTCLEAKELRS